MDKSEVSPETKLRKIHSFLVSYGYPVKKIIQHIIKKLDDLPDTIASVIDVLWRTVNGLERRAKKEVIIKAMELLGSTLSLIGVAFPMIGLIAKIVSLVVKILKIIFHFIDFDGVFKLKYYKKSDIKHKLAGLAEILKKTERFIANVDGEEHVGETALAFLQSKVDINIGVHEIGTLKSRIGDLIKEEKDSWFQALELFRMYVIISTLRHSLLFRYMTCLKSKDYNPIIISALENHLKEERKENQKFLAGYFSVPTPEKVGILTIFYPSEEKEIVTYLKELRLPYQNLSEELDGKVLLIQPSMKPSIYCGRPFLSFSSVRAMDSSTDVWNVRIGFQFMSIKDASNLFYIHSPDLTQYVYMKENSYCKYKKMSYVPDNAQWRVILVDVKDNASSCFIICTRKWPDKFLHIEESFFECAKGRENAFKSMNSKDFLFTLTPPNRSPIFVHMSEPGDLSDFGIDDEFKDIDALPTNSSKGKQQDRSFLKTIQNFLDERNVNVENDIEKIDFYIIRDDTNSLHSFLKRIAYNLSFLDEDEFSDKNMHGILGMISINFELFQKGSCSIFRQLFRVCGLVLSCVWKTGNIKDFILCHFNLDSTYRVQIAQDISAMKRFASRLNGIEKEENIKESDITNMTTDGKFCEGLNCLEALKEVVASDPFLILPYVKVRIFQFTILLQMHAIANLPGHSEKIAKAMLNNIMLEKDDDKTFTKQFLENNSTSETSVDMTLVKNYVSCLSCGSGNPKLPDITKLTTEQKLECMRVVALPLLDELYRDRTDWLTPNPNYL